MNDLLLNDLAHARLTELRHEAAVNRLARQVVRLRRIARPLIPRQRGARFGS